MPKAKKIFFAEKMRFKVFMTEKLLKANNTIFCHETQPISSASAGEKTTYSPPRTPTLMTVEDGGQPINCPSVKSDSTPVADKPSHAACGTMPMDSTGSNGLLPRSLQVDLTYSPFPSTMLNSRTDGRLPVQCNSALPKTTTMGLTDYKSSHVRSTTFQQSMTDFHKDTTCPALNAETDGRQPG